MLFTERKGHIGKFISIFELIKGNRWGIYECLLQHQALNNGDFDIK